MTLDIVEAPYNHEPNRGFSLREMVLLAVGTPAAPLSIDEAYHAFQALVSQLRNKFPYHIPSQKTFEEFIEKLARKGVLDSTNIRTEDGRQIHTYFLSDIGFKEYQNILDEMASSVRFVDAIKFIRKSFWD
ncbi:MAG: hypothetical protein D6732_19415 [Methanobacteriota archaeon]|nr:MAG: hypothetical protein D6732_19415 [Euryarchaeota archaeon]